MIPEAIEEKGQVYVHVNKLLEEREKTTRSMLELERYKNIIDELEKELELNLKFRVIGVRRLLNKLKELKGE